MTAHLMRKALVALTVSVGLVAGTTASEVEGAKYRCTADKNTVSHDLTVHVHDGKVGSFSYMAATPADGAVNSCTVDSSGAKEADIGPGVQSFQTDAGQVVVTRKGKKFDFDFTKISMSDVCGQSSTIAAHIDLTPGSKHCTDVRNRE
jgi:hypothetical protein